MTFPKKPLHDELFAREWPEKYPFPPEAFKRQDEQDDSDFYSTPRLVYHIDEGAVRSLTNYYKVSPGPHPNPKPTLAVALALAPTLLTRSRRAWPTRTSPCCCASAAPTS